MDVTVPFLIIFAFLTSVVVSDDSTNNHSDETIKRSKRQLIYPPPALFQMTTGVALPLPLMSTYREIHSNWAYQANFNCPSNLTQVPLFYLLGPAITTERRKRDLEAIMSTTYPPVQLEDIFSYDVMTLDMYIVIKETIEGYGYHGESCLLRTICELAEVPFHLNSNGDVFHEIVHFVFTPSSHEVSEVPNENIPGKGRIYGSPLEPYLEAEEHGKRGGDCAKKYSNCEMSILGLFTTLFYDGYS